MSLLTLEEIHKEYRSRAVLNGVSLRVEKGERVALIGPNGSGKTTLLKIALGKETPDSGRVVIARNTRVGYISQDIVDLPDSTYDMNETALHYEKAYKLEVKMRDIEHQLEKITEGVKSEEYDRLIRYYSKLQIEYEAMDGYSISSRIKTVLLGLGLREEVLDIPLHMLSGGEKMRVAIARVLLDEPDLIILDEPTNHLDIHAVEWLESFLKKFEGGVLIVSHDRYFLDQTATRLVELENGMVIERKGGYTTFIEQKAKEKEFLLNSQSRLKREINSQKQVALELKSMNRIKASKSRIKTVERLERELAESYEIKNRQHLNAGKGLQFSLDNAKHISAEIAKAESLKKSFGDHVLFKDVNFLIRGKEHVGIVGDNGTGKSTLLNILRGIDRDFAGTASLGSWVKYAYLSQNICFNSEEFTIMDEILSRKEMEKRQVLDHLKRFKFYGDDVNKMVGVLSGGEKVRLYMACIMLESPDCLIMDEPTNHLDIDAREALENALKEFNGSIIAVSHDRYFLTRCIDRILEISDGSIWSYGGNYEAYRQAKLIEGRKASVTNSEALKYSAGRGDRRKPAAGKDTYCRQPKQEMCMQELESRILEIEEMVRGLEGSFDNETLPEKYREYDKLINELNDLYGQWESLID